MQVVNEIEFMKITPGTVGSAAIHSPSPSISPSRRLKRGSDAKHSRVNMIAALGPCDADIAAAHTIPNTVKSSSEDAASTDHDLITVVRTLRSIGRLGLN